MQTEPLISIIITSFNYGQYIKDAINSCLEQDYKNIEIIVVDDGSSDNTHSILEEYSSRIITCNNPYPFRSAAARDACGSRLHTHT